MKVFIVNLTSDENVSVRTFQSPDMVSVKTREFIQLGKNEIGIILGRKSNMLQGAFCQSGIVHPGFKGKLEPFFIVYGVGHGSWTIPVGALVAHLLILNTEKEVDELDGITKFIKNELVTIT